VARDIADYHGAGSHECSVSDRDMIDDRCADSYEDIAADRRSAADGAPGAEGGEIADINVVTDDRTDVDENVVTEAYAAVHDCHRCDRAARTEAGIGRDPGLGGNHGHERRAFPTLNEPPTHLARADRRHDSDVFDIVLIVHIDDGGTVLSDVTLVCGRHILDEKRGCEPDVGTVRARFEGLAPGGKYADTTPHRMPMLAGVSMRSECGDDVYRAGVDVERAGIPPGVPSLVGRDLGVRVVSYSQNAEDVRLWRVFRGVTHGFYVDIGANHPETGSVTKLFSDAGWQGINVEPGPTWELLVNARRRDINVKAVIGSETGTVDFWVTYPETGLSTARPDVHAHVPELIERYEQVEVPASRLADVLAQHAGTRTIHFLKIDVEGAEGDVIASSDWSRFRPMVVVVEAVATMDSAPTHAEWEPRLLGAGYEFACFDGLNRFYVAAEHSDLRPGLAYPMGVLDRYVTIEQLELEGERLALRAALDTAQARQAELESDADALRAQLTAVLSSRTWRAGRALWYAAAPWRSLRQRLTR
jgi:FkbM family methyltransferase